MGTTRESELRLHQYEWGTAWGGCMSRVNGLAHAVRIRLNGRISFLGPFERRTPIMCGGRAVRSSRKLLALDVHGG
jgi:hypothetical protein